MRTAKRSILRIGSILILAALSITAASAQTSADSAAGRRKALSERLGKGLAVVPAQTPSARGPQENNDFYYLTGIMEPEAILVVAGEGEKRETLFNRSGKWNGPSGTTPDVLPSSDLRKFFMSRAAQKRIYLSFSALDGVLQTIGGGSVLAFAAEIANIDPILAEMRIVKSAEEIKILQAAIDITADAYIDALKAAKPGARELDLDAVLQYNYIRSGAEKSFLQVASGPNSINVHFGSTTREMKAGEVIVFDIGAWFERYTSDISRTVPVSGRFTKEQAELYNVVLEAQKEGIRLMVVGNGIQKTQTAVEDALLTGLAKLGLVTDAASPWQRRLFIQHGFIHGIGLDIHDVWNWFSREMRNGLAFKPGMVLTMEPGLYFPEKMLETTPGGPRAQVKEDEFKAFAAKVAPIFKKYAGMGCRIEDDVLVTETGNQVLTVRAPKEIMDIEKIMKAAARPGR
ncbi:MAG: aminopeptidase P N-terminal domain-containing protein [Candidatus Aminicenantes bacterium]|nr:aminopeptidase P N-terminal domain-containing protein [Candidatus Aminicenantes bacterium]